MKIIHKNSGQVVEDFPWYGKFHYSMYGYLMLTPDNFVYFIYIQDENINYSDVTDEYEIIEEPITYTEEEVKELINLAWATASAYADKTNQADCDDWFMWNKKK